MAKEQNDEADKQGGGGDQEVDQGTPFTPWPWVIEGADERTRQQPGKPDAGSGNEDAPPNALLVQQVAEQREANRIQRIISLTGMALFVGTVVANIFLYTVSNKSADAAKSSAETASRDLELSQRPWITAKLAIRSRFVVEKDGARIALLMELENTGRSPATYVEVSVEMFPMDFSRYNEFPPERQEAQCNGAAALSERLVSSGMQPRLTMFPNQKMSRVEVPSMGIDAIKATIRSDQEGGFLPMVSVCVSYRFSFDVTRGDRIAYMFQLQRLNPARDPSDPERFYIWKLPNGVDPDDTVKLVPHYFGGSGTIGSRPTPMAKQTPEDRGTDEQAPPAP